jgi:hypothetical protein
MTMDDPAREIRAGNAATRLSAAETDVLHREQRQADALRYLTRRGLLDVAEMLGLDGAARRTVCGAPNEQ